MKRKTAIVTGSTQGMGAATAIRLAQDGYNVVVNSRSDKKYEAGMRIVEECKKHGVDAYASRLMYLLRRTVTEW